MIQNNKKAIYIFLIILGFLHIIYCVPCPISANSCANDCNPDGSIQDCNACADSYFFSGNCYLCASSMTGCTSCTSEFACSICESTHIKNTANKCTPCSGVIDNCEICTNSTYCTHCITYWTLYYNHASCFNCSL
jgi:hypothetical protein